MSFSRAGRRLLVAGLLTAPLLLAGCGGSGPVATVSGGTAPAGGLRGAVLPRPIAKPDVRLTDTAGRPYDLRRRTHDRVTLVYFGYTHCPDVCPATMADLAAALSQVKADVKAQVSVVFVATDPQRDTPPVLRRWLRQFDPSFVGLTGPLPRVRAAAAAMGVPLEDPERQPDGSYAVTHGTQVVAFGRDDLARVLYLAGTDVPDYVHDLPLLVARPTAPATAAPGGTVGA